MNPLPIPAAIQPNSPKLSSCPNFKQFDLQDIFGITSVVDHQRGFTTGTDLNTRDMGCTLCNLVTLKVCVPWENEIE